MLPSTPKAPPALFELQYWFQTVLTLPIDENNQMVTNRSIEKEACYYVCPSLHLLPKERMGIYHQQYWWRLLSCLHQIFPTLIRVFGYIDFNLSIGVPYLSKYQPRHWSLSMLGLQMPNWIKESYLENDKPLILYSALLDLAYDATFSAPCPKKICFSENLLNAPLSLQPHVKLFALPFDLFTFRAALLQKDPTFWIDHDFPLLSKEQNYYFVLYKNYNQAIIHQQISEGHWILLDCIQKGMTIEKACDSLETIGGSAYEEANHALASWINTWILKSWLTPNQRNYHE